MLVLFSAGGDVEGRRLEEGGEEDEEEDQEHRRNGYGGDDDDLRGDDSNAEQNDHGMRKTMKTSEVI